MSHATVLQVLLLREQLDELRATVRSLQQSEREAWRHVECVRRREHESNERAEEVRYEFASAAAAFRTKLSRELKRELTARNLEIEQLRRDYDAERGGAQREGVA